MGLNQDWKIIKDWKFWTVTTSNGELNLLQRRLCSILPIKLSKDFSKKFLCSSFASLYYYLSSSLFSSTFCDDPLIKLSFFNLFLHFYVHSIYNDWRSKNIKYYCFMPQTIGSILNKGNISVHEPFEFMMCAFVLRYWWRKDQGMYGRAMVYQ